MTIIRVRAGFHLVDEIAHGQCMELAGAEYKRLLALVDHSHEQIHAISFAFHDLDDLVEIFLRIEPPGLHVSLNQFVIGSVDVFI